MSIDLSGVSEFEWRGRTTHLHWDGVDIQRQCYVQPFSEAPNVAAAFQGSVNSIITPSPHWVRTLPARDAYYLDAYCNEVKIDHVDPQQDSIGVSPTTGWDHIIPKTDETLEMVSAGSKERAAGGAFLTATYRPLISAYMPGVSPGDAEAEPSLAERSKMFDWIDPTFSPGSKSIPWPLGLGTQVPGWQPFSAQVPPDAANPVHVPMHEFTIKRLLVAEIPWNTIKALTNTVNAGQRPQEGTTAEQLADGPGWPYRDEFGQIDLPTFPPGTLRFDKCDAIRHYSPGSFQQRWYELIYHFSWLCLSAKNVHNRLGQDLTPLGGLAPVTWNHVLMRPSKLTEKAPVGWYFVQKYSPWSIVRLPFIQNVTVADGAIYSYGDFNTLFDLQAQ